MQLQEQHNNPYDGRKATPVVTRFPIHGSMIAPHIKILSFQLIDRYQTLHE